MKAKEIIGLISIVAAATTGVVAHRARKEAEERSYTAELMNPIEQRERGFYEKYVKRMFDIACSVGAITVFSPLYLGVAGLVKKKLGSPVLFTQERPGMIGEDGKEIIFKMYKFRTMTDERDENGELLPDDVRLTKFGAWLRSTSLDELPEAFNIFNGTMSVVGPRPQLVRDMVFMNEKQRARHTAKPGLSGLAQIKGRNSIKWEEKFDWDMKYVDNINFRNDCKIVFDTIKKAFIDREGITEDNKATADDYGDYLLHNKIIEQNDYEKKQNEAKSILNKRKCINENMAN